MIDAVLSAREEKRAAAEKAMRDAMRASDRLRSKRWRPVRRQADASIHS